MKMKSLGKLAGLGAIEDQLENFHQKTFARIPIEWRFAIAILTYLLDLGLGISAAVLKLMAFAPIPGLNIAFLALGDFLSKAAEVIGTAVAIALWGKYGALEAIEIMLSFIPGGSIVAAILPTEIIAGIWSTMARGAHGEKEKEKNIRQLVDSVLQAVATAPIKKVSPVRAADRAAQSVISSAPPVLKKELGQIAERLIDAVNDAGLRGAYPLAAAQEVGQEVLDDLDAELKLMKKTKPSLKIDKGQILNWLAAILIGGVVLGLLVAYTPLTIVGGFELVTIGVVGFVCWKCRQNLVDFFKKRGKSLLVSALAIIALALLIKLTPLTLAGGIYIAIISLAGWRLANYIRGKI